MLEKGVAVRTVGSHAIVADELVGRKAVLRSLRTDDGLTVVHRAMTLPKGNPCPEAEIRAVHGILL